MASRLERSYDGKTCRICLKMITELENVVVATVPTKKLKRLSDKSKSKMKISWELNEKANQFHEFCWENLGKSELSSVETNLLVDINETVEKYYALSNLSASVTALATLLKESKHTVSFTGAGISVSSGIPTYRGAEGIDTAQLLAVATENNDDDGDIDYRRLEPSLTHRGLAELNRHGMMNYIITQNCDNLHYKGGFPRDKMSELHGNVFVEFCEKCETEYVRDYSVDEFSTDCCYRCALFLQNSHTEPWYEKCPSCKWNHYTGRKCSIKSCGGKLRDTIVNFGDDLHNSVLGGLPKAEAESAKADLCLCLGTSLTVTPANSLPQKAKHIVICNPQVTHLDHLATVRIWASVDTVFQLLFDELGFTIPPIKSGSQTKKRTKKSVKVKSSFPSSSSSSSAKGVGSSKASKDNGKNRTAGNTSATQPVIAVIAPSTTGGSTTSRKRKAGAVIDLTHDSP